MLSHFWSLALHLESVIFHWCFPCFCKKWWSDILVDKTVCGRACESCQNQAQHKLVKENPMPSNTATLFKTQILTQLHLKSKRDKFTILYSMLMFPKRSLTTPFLKPILCQLTKESSGWFLLAFEHTHTHMKDKCWLKRENSCDALSRWHLGLKENVEVRAVVEWTLTTRAGSSFHAQNKLTDQLSATDLYWIIIIIYHFFPLSHDWQS